MLVIVADEFKASILYVLSEPRITLRQWGELMVFRNGPIQAHMRESVLHGMDNGHGPVVATSKRGGVDDDTQIIQIRLGHSGTNS